MAHAAADPKAAPLADDLKEFARSLQQNVFPKTFFCTLDNQLAIDSYKLLCCNKAICPSCQEKLTFPTTCPSCDHSPLEADSCAPNKALRNTMRVWLQKQKKKEEAKAASQAPPTPVETTPAAPEVQPVGDAADKPVESIEETPKAEGAGGEQIAEEVSGDADDRTGSAAVQTNEDSAAPQDEGNERRGSAASQLVNKTVEPSTNDAATNEPTNTGDLSAGMLANNPMTLNGQLPYGMGNQAGFNNSMGFPMNNMNAMSNMIGSGNWNGMNSMDFNNMNGMYGNYGGNMGMGMNDMSAMNYGGGYGGWNGIGGGYGNYNNGFNPMGGYNQSGAYPEMMNQFPKNNFPNQNQNRFPANQGGAYAQRNMRNGSQGGFGSGAQNAHSRPGSQSGPAHNRDGQSPDGNADPAFDAKTGEEQAKTSAEPTEEGKANDEGAPVSAEDNMASGDAGNAAGESTDSAGNATNETGGLNPIQTFDSGDGDMGGFAQPMMGNGMGFQQGMIGPSGYDQSLMDPSFNHNMNTAYNNFGPRGAFNNGGAYGAAKVLTEQPAQPTGVGVVGAPTGPRAMREGRPNTGFSSRVTSARFAQPAKSVASTHDAVPDSPQRRMRSRSPQRDESMRVKNKSPSRSRSRSRARDHGRDEYRERSRSRSADRESRHEDRERSLPQRDEDDYDRLNERRDQRSSRYDDRQDDYDDRRRDGRESRGDRTRTASVESKYRDSRRDKEKYRSSRSQRDCSKEHRRRHRSQSPPEGKYEDDDAYARSERGSDGSSRRKHRSEKDKYRDRSRDRDRKDRKERDRDYDYEHERSRDKNKDRKRRRDREAEEVDHDYEDDKHRSSRRSRKDRGRERSSRYASRERDERDEREYKDDKKSKPVDREEDIVGAMMKKRAPSPPLNAPTGPSANGISIKGRSKNVMPPPSVQPPTGPRGFQPPKGPAADRNRERDHRRRSSNVSGGVPSPKEPPMQSQDHYAAERERNARERDSREKPGNSKSLSSRISSSHSSSKRGYEDEVPEAPRGPRAEPTGPHRDKRRKSGATGDDNIAKMFTAGLRKKARRGGVRVEGDEEGDLRRVERERERR